MMPNPGIERQTPTAQIAVCMLVATSEGFDLAAMGLAGPGMISALGLSRSAFGLAATTMMAGFFVGAALGGVLGDRYGRRRVMVIAMIIVGIFSLITAQVQELPWLLLARFLAGIGIGGVFPNLLVLAADTASPAGRGRAIALTNCGGSIGGLSAGMLLAIGGGAVGWQWFFLIGSALPVLIVPLVLLVLRESRAPASASAPRAMSAGSALFGEHRAPVTLLFWTANFFTAFMYYMVASWAPTLLAERGLPATTLGAANAAMAIGAMIGALGLTTLLDKRWHRLPFVLAYGGMMVAFAVFANAISPPAAIIAMSLIGLSVMGGQLLLYAVAPMLYPPEVRSTGVGSSIAVGRLGAIVSPWAVGAALDAGLRQDDLVWLMTPAIIVAGFCSIYALRRSTQQDSTGQHSSGPTPV